VLLAEMFAARSSRNIIPLTFIAVIVLLAARYGAAVGIFGSLVAALIFSIFLFAPLHNVSVQNDTGSNIDWMLLAGIALPYLLAGPPQHPRTSKVSYSAALLASVSRNLERRQSRRFALF
jgi:K+-sensing histidine kinase KdpD